MRPADIGGLVFLVGFLVPMSLGAWYMVVMIALATWRQWKATGILRLPEKI